MSGYLKTLYPLVSQEKGVYMMGNQEEKYTILYARLSEEDARAAVQEAQTEASSGPALSFNGEL